MYRILSLSCVIALMFACSGKDSNQKVDETKSSTPKVVAKDTKKDEAKPIAKPVAKPKAPVSKYKKPNDASAITDDGKVVTVKLGSTDQMKYTFSQIDIPAGRKVKLTLTHLGKMPATAMGHNFVLLQKGEDPVAFASRGMSAAANDYIALGSEAKVIAKTRIIGGGESQTIEFDAPAPGTYSFVCTKPGHASMMKGVLIVK
jgi:azurin